MRLVFDPAEAERLRATAREESLRRPLLAYALEQVATEGIDLDSCATWEDLREQYGIPSSEDSASDVA